MKDEMKREKGKYVEQFSKTVDNREDVTVYKIIETTIVGRNYEVLSFVREYDPAIPYK